MSLLLFFPHPSPKITDNLSIASLEAIQNMVPSMSAVTKLNADVSLSSIDTIKPIMKKIEKN